MLYLNIIHNFKCNSLFLNVYISYNLFTLNVKFMFSFNPLYFIFFSNCLSYLFYPLESPFSLIFFASSSSTNIEYVIKDNLLEHPHFLCEVSFAQINPLDMLLYLLPMISALNDTRCNLISYGTPCLL
jgi:hypothetical protein